MKIKCADLVFDIKNNYNYTRLLSHKYIFEGKSSDVSITVSDEDIKQELNCDIIDKSYAESVCVYRKMGEILPFYNAFIFHSAVFDFDGTGVALTAHSGTGKTTHLLLWHKLFAKKMSIVNGDKPIVRFFENEPNIPYGYGTPWCGKEKYTVNMRTPIKHICFIERSEKNFVEKLQPSEIINLIFNQVYMPKDPKAVAATMQLINRFIGCCELWRIHCNMDISAAETAYRAIFKEN